MEGSKPEIAHNWTPLERALPSSLWDDFMHMGEDGTIQKYKHRDTRRYLYIDADCERFYRWVGGDGETKYEEIHQTSALLYALPGIECAGTVAPKGPDPAWLRANSLITVFLDLQSCAVWWVAIDADKGPNILRLLSYIAGDMAVLGRIAGMNWDDSEEAFLAVVARIRTTVEMLEVPAEWSLRPCKDGDVPSLVVAAWQAFCDLLAAEMSTEPFYGVVNYPEPAAVHEPSRQDETIVPDPTRGLGLWRRLRQLLEV